MFKQRKKLKRLAKQLRASVHRAQNAELELEQQIECLNDAAIVSETDAQGNITYVNDRFCEISKYNRLELIGQNHRLLKSNHQPEELFVDMWKTISRGKTWHGEVKNRAKDGSYYWVDTTITPFVDRNGVIYKYVSVRFDITEQKKIQMEQRERESLKFHSLVQSSRLNPHFIFNSLNAIQHYILNRDMEASLQYVSQFATLMRSVLDNSGRHFIPLANELEFLRNYLELEEERFQNTYEYTIHVEDSIDVDEVEIPPMLFQPYIENILVHAFIGIDYKGKIEIEFKSLNKTGLQCKIRDNGIGREQAAAIKASKCSGNKQHQSKGMGLVEGRLNTLKQLGFCDSETWIEDLHDESGKAQGTEVTVSLIYKNMK